MVIPLHKPETLPCFPSYFTGKISGQAKLPLDKLEGKKEQFSNERKKNTMFPFVYPMISLDFQVLLKELANVAPARECKQSLDAVVVDAIE